MRVKLKKQCGEIIKTLHIIGERGGGGASDIRARHDGGKLDLKLI